MATPQQKKTFVRAPSRSSQPPTGQPPAGRDRRCRDQRDGRRGATVVLAAFLMVVMLGVVAFAVDLGYVLKVKTDLDRSIDAAALAGAGLLVNGQADAEAAAVEFLVRNPTGYQNAVDPELLEQQVAEFLAIHGEELEMEVGHWDPDATDAEGNVGALVAATERPSAIRVALSHNDHPYFFGRIFGGSTFDVESEAIASYQPRDIMVVLDLSASMNDDSEFKSIGSLGRSAIEAGLEQIYEDLGSPTYGTMQFQPVYISTNKTWKIKNKLGLKNLPYPHSQGSWNEYISYMKSSGTQPASWGYRKKYGYLTLINYWLDMRPLNNETGNLWQASAQPVTAVKNSVSLFIDYVQEVDTEDRIGLSVYNDQNGNGKLESGLTTDFASLVALSNAKQAGHYHGWTNIGGGLEVARAELQANAREGSYRLIVLMTDGVANWNNGGYNPTAARQHVLGEAAAAADLGIKIMTISLGAGADTGLMEDVADITGGVHFNIPGGQTVAEYAQDLTDTFHTIADDRPLKLVR
ncbi:MAG: VWA domain-containing protein [Planctomycetota bacterium]|nr:MAG: VWA domain-containing protein [Planctomycetota bacterium]REJ98812.1 MAG: VWA domain-containing protein [Planctomycetota bacterium]REK22149.1 MAG: VWA domain-containing protein [Planctomycetota bacterium]REK39964.1 MAG: VWA domain-containing protein [Planctomycetota bacterium]